MGEIVERYYRTGAECQKEHFPGAPIAGDRYLYGDHPDPVIESVSRHVDAISMQIGDGYGETMLPSWPFPIEELHRFHERAGKPILIVDHQISFFTDTYSRTIFSQSGDEKAASKATVEFFSDPFSTDYICGYFHCTYLTQEAEQGRGVKQGLVDFDQIPYSEMAAAYRTMNGSIREFRP